MTESTESESHLDDLIGSARAARRNSADALDDLIAASGVTAAPKSDPESDPESTPESTPAVDRADLRRRWTIALSFALFALALSGVLTDAVAASQLITDSGPSAIAIVWPLAGLALLLVALLQARVVDRFARLPVLVNLCLIYAVAFVVVLILFATNVPTSVPAALAWLLADQMNFLLPLLVWALAGDVFTAGQGISVFPRMSRWLYIGQIGGFALATVTPFAFDRGSISLNLLLVLPPIACVAVALIVPPALRAASTSAGHGREVTMTSVVVDTWKFVGELPAFSWLWRASLVVMIGGVMIEFSFFDQVVDRFTDASGLQVVYAGTSLAGFVLCWIIQSVAATPLMNRLGVAKVLLILPVGTAIAAVALVVAGISGMAAVTVIGLLLWRIPRWSVDTTARQAAMATLPDERRASASFLINLVPFALGLIVVAPVIVLSGSLGVLWLAPAVAAVLSVLALVFGRRVIATWDDTQLSYRLKRRRRLG